MNYAWPDAKGSVEDCSLNGVWFLSSHTSMAFDYNPFAFWLFLRALLVIKFFIVSIVFLWEKAQEPIRRAFELFVIFFLTTLGAFLLAWAWHSYKDMKNQVKKKFENPEPPKLIREGYHFVRDEEDEIRNAFLNKTDTMGLVGVIFGPAGKGKSNVVRQVCIEKREDQTDDQDNYKGVSGVIYMEIGSPYQFASHLAKACGVPVEPSWYDAMVSKLFSSLRTNLTLPDDDVAALASILPIIAEGCKVYQNDHDQHVPVLFIDGADILAKCENKSLYKTLVDWAKKCANEDSLQIVLVSSDSHVLALDQQSFKSRLADLIEINDVKRDQAVKLMIEKYYFDEYFAELIFDRIGGRLADIHKVVAIWRKKTSRKIHPAVVEAVKNNNGIDGEQLTQAVFDALQTIPHNAGSEADASNQLTSEEMYLTLGMMRRYHWQGDIDAIEIPPKVERVIDAMMGAGCSDRDHLKNAIYDVLDVANATDNQRVMPLRTYPIELDIQSLAKVTIKEWSWCRKLSLEIEEQFIREAEQAFCKVLGNDKYEWRLKRYIINSVLNESKTVEQIALDYAKRHRTSTQTVIVVIQEFLDNNVLRITKHRTLHCYNGIAENLL